ncbi:hypothetical protein [Pseudaminobacter soli (ex Li et al. 2025)]|uniref:ABC transporter substrate-binding protein n=1 Tax=Pseudaminobacter soli (ex Li et al. 2025) TaxID=1295366 RepID=A0A2P7SE70_9HYPH|nr:hypothetical protein [Mesorhizobium soli]PSJ60763.1 hypothetical protein C7I85_12025 [Mesorhizobium soli]
MVRTFRSLFFGGLAMLAAAIIFSMPASAVSRDTGIYNLTYEPPGYIVPDLMKVAAINPEREAVPKPGDAPFDLVYTRSNQSLTAWRIAVDAYSHIDPHIAQA